MGDTSLLLPDGIRDIRDLPHTYHDSIVLALHFLSFEELPSEDQPPREIWMDPDAMGEHWEMVKRRNEARYGKGDIRDDEIEGPVEDNEAMAEIFPGLER
jgi:hypothetical protein